MDEDSLGAWMRLRAPSGGSERVTKVLAGVGAASLAFYGAKFLLNFFGPTLPYSLSDAVGCELDSEEFLEFLSTVTDGTVRESRLTRLKNGVEFYPAELEAIRGAKRAINLEFYEFMEGEVSREMLDALAERASAGVEVRVLVDAVGSFTTPDGYFEGLRRAGGRMCWYHPVRWNTWQMVNNRSHRKLLVVDGKVGFIGGAGVAGHDVSRGGERSCRPDFNFRRELAGGGGRDSRGAGAVRFHGEAGGCEELRRDQHAARRQHADADLISSTDYEREAIHPHYDAVLSAGPERTRRVD
jgi:hypothetical protein